jgi:hypothetical protein
MLGLPVAAALAAACEPGGGDARAACPFLGGCDTLRPPPPSERAPLPGEHAEVAAAPVAPDTMPRVPVEPRALDGPAAAAVEVTPPRATIWVGDTVRLRAEVRDSAGAPVLAAVRWLSPPGGLAAVSPDGLLTAFAAGEARVGAESGGARGAASLTILPVLRGRLIAPDDAPLGGARVEVGVAGARLAGAVAPDGRFTVRLPRPVDDSVHLAGGETGVGRHHPIGLWVGARELSDEVRVVLVPTEWRIGGGRHAGATVPILPAAALRRAPDGTRFWRLYRSLTTGEWQGVTWPGGRLPLPIVLRGAARSEEEGFWSVARALEEDFGVRLFRPATAEEQTREVGVVTVDVDPGLARAGLTYIAFDGRGEILGAEVLVRSASWPEESGVLGHELVHALGFGHTMAWSSLMAPVSGHVGRATAADVAHALVMYAVRDAQRRHGARHALPAGAVGVSLTGGGSNPP